MKKKELIKIIKASFKQQILLQKSMKGQTGEPQWEKGYKEGWTDSIETIIKCIKEYV